MSTPTSAARKPFTRTSPNARRPHSSRRLSWIRPTCPVAAGILFDHFAARPDHYRLITWGRLELAESAGNTTSRLQATIAGKLDKLRDAQRTGLLDPVWDPVDILALINQIAMTWAGQPEIAAAAADQAVDPSITARRAALVTAVERVFPRPD